MLHLNPIILGHLPHRLIHIIIHTSAPPKELLELAEVEIRIARQQHDPEDHVAAVVAPPLAPAKICVFGEGSRCPVAGDLDPVDGGAEVLVVSLHDAHVPADEDEFAGPFLLVAEDLFDASAHCLLHLVLTFALLAFR